MAAICEHLKADGQRCRARPRPGSRSCPFHDDDPATAEARREGRRRGGRERSRRAAVLPADTPDAPLGTVQDAVALLARTANQVLRGEIDPKVGNAVGYLVSVQLRAVQADGWQARVEALEAILKARGKSRP